MNFFNRTFRKKSSTKPAPYAGAPYVLKTYLREDGSFDYPLYKSIQNEGNKAKIDKCWVQPENIAFLSDYLQSQLGDIRFGLCHGTRRGLEQKWFREHLGCEVIGTEIAETATQFPDTIQWDFHDVKPEWVGAVDFIYSNSLDHSYDPGLCLNRWMSSLRPGGICIVEHTSVDEPEYATDLDPFGANLWIMPYLVLEWSKGNFCVDAILDAPVGKRKIEYTKFLIIKNTAQPVAALPDAFVAKKRFRPSFDVSERAQAR
jgi:hypothetical protein